MQIFFRDALRGFEITWNQLLFDINSSYIFNTYCVTDNYYDIFKQIIISMIIGEKIILLDSDFSKDEIFKLTGTDELKKFEKKIDSQRLNYFKSKNELLNRLIIPCSTWSISICTSGTTGLPKIINHNYESITRFVKITESTISNIWGFAYNPTHMAGIQVFMQALLNGNTNIRLFGLPKNQIFDEIKKYCITNISATPTFYRLLLPCNEQFYSIKRVTSGGEKYDEKTARQLISIFPNAKFTNIYASTEVGTILAAKGNVFTIKPSIEHLVKIENEELCIHSSLLADTSQNDDDWYMTGDLVEVISTDPITFQFTSRKNEMINVGGYKVYPNEVEEIIRNIPGVFDALVYAKKNSILGSVICCEVVKDDSLINESLIRSFLRSRIQEFKIPRIINFVETLSTTRTGKIKRKQ